MDENWLLEKGSELLESLGLEKGQIVLDFGCGDGSYTIPAARTVGEEGKVYALDRKKKKIEKLKERTEKLGINNVERMELGEEPDIDLPDNVIDFCLLYDVIHLLLNRKKVYQEIRRVLKKNGVLSLYPTHYDQPFVFSKVMGFGMSKKLKDIIGEVKEEGFKLTGKFEEELMHYRSLEGGTVLNFKVMK